MPHFCIFVANNRAQSHEETFPFVGIHYVGFQRLQAVEAILTIRLVVLLVGRLVEVEVEDIRGGGELFYK